MAEGRKIEDFFAKGEDFEEVLESAEQAVTNGYQSDVCYKWRQAWDQYGMRAFMTNQQYEILMRLAGFEPSA
jgi:hypothetical protein